MKREYSDKTKCPYCGKKFEWGSIIKCYIPSCDCQEKINLKKEEEKIAGEYFNNKVKLIKSYAGMEKRFQDKTFDNYNKTQNPKAYEETFNYVKNLKNNLSKGKGLILTGTVGSGKTHLIASMIDYIAKAYTNWIESGDIIFINTVELLSRIKFSFGNNTTEKIIEPYEDCKLLFIDDLGVGKITDWTVGILYKIINKRYEKKLSIIIATNMSIPELKDTLDERLFSRILEICKGIKLTGRDYRLVNILPGTDINNTAPIRT